MHKLSAVSALRSVDKSRRKLLCVCRWRGAKLKAEAKAKRREECSTKGACVLQLGLCVCIRLCVYVTGLPKLLHVKDAPK